MFAKLKEKIQKEGGTVALSETVPGHASPRRISISGSPAPSPATKDQFVDGYITDDGKTDYGSKEEVLTVLQKRTDQCKKLELKLNEYASVIKDYTKKIDKLETYIEKQQEAVAKRTQDLNEQFQVTRVKMTDNYKIELEKKDKEMEELLQKLRETESIREKYYKKEEEKEEMQGFATQEMGKLKHMMIMNEEELARCQAELLDKGRLLEAEQKTSKDLKNELISMQDKVKTERCRLEDESVGHSKIVSTLTKERMALEESLTDIKSQLTEKSSTMSSIQSKYADLESTHQTLVRNSELYKNKMNQQHQEKDDQIEQLQERVKLLEQREQDHTLSGDERLVALEKERDGLERKLTETREQLSQIKSSWSEKITHLEDQISHLNGKIAEDNEELSQAQTTTDMVRTNMQKEIESMKEKLSESNKKVEENTELVTSKEAYFKKEKLELETEVSQMKLEMVDLETQLRSKIISLENQILSLERVKTHEKSLLEEQISKYECEEKESLEKLVCTETRLEEAEDTNHKLQSQIKEVEKTCDNLKLEINNKQTQLAQVKAQVKMLEDELKLSKEKLETSKEKSKSIDSELISCNKEKDELMLRNAELSQQLAAVQRSAQNDKNMLEEDKRGLEHDLKATTEAENMLKQQCEELANKVEEMTLAQSNHTSNSEDIGRLQETVTALEDQLMEKNKALKKQEQRLNDLKKTLQRELKVQSLPNDEPIDPKMAALTPPLPRKNSLTKNTHHSDNSLRTKRQNSHDQSPYSNDHDNQGSSTNSYGTQDFFVGQNLTLGHGSDANRTPYGVKSSHGHATISVNERVGAQYSADSYTSQNYSRTATTREFDTRHLEKDINFMYLKHVVMKFMLSREHEAIQLIKAVSLLLRFTPDEQKLIKDTLEWKMSWFGGTQPPAVLKGHANKIIPPSY